MRRIAASLLLSAIICLSSCAFPQPVLVTPALDMPARPVMLEVRWMDWVPFEGLTYEEFGAVLHGLVTTDGLHCLTDAELRNLLVNISRLRSHIVVLEGYVKAVVN